MGISLQVLKQHIKDGTIRASKLPNGDMAVPESEIPNITKEQFEHLRRKAITVTAAHEKYNVHRDTLLKWVSYGHITVMKPGYRMTLDESDVAYLAAIYHQMGGGRGKRIVDDAGRPYKLKRPKAAEYRRAYRRKKKLES